MHVAVLGVEVIRLMTMTTLNGRLDMHTTTDIDRGLPL